MNTKDRTSENRSGIAKQKKTFKHPFEWPGDQQDPVHYIDSHVPWLRGEHVSNWGMFWFTAWLGTTIAGSLFGGALGLLGANKDLLAPLLGLFFGAMWAGAVGLFVHVHLVAICWAFWWLGRPLVVAVVAGVLTGAICGLVLFSIITAPLGALGAYLAGSTFLKSSRGRQFLSKISNLQDQSLGRMRFTMKDLFLRITLLAVFLAGWTAWLK